MIFSANELFKRVFLEGGKPIMSSYFDRRSGQTFGSTNDVHPVIFESKKMCTNKGILITQRCIKALL